MPKKSILASLGFDETVLNRLYVKSKIAASPTDYTLKDRLVVEENPQKFDEYTNILYLGDKCELELYGLLGCDHTGNRLQLKDMTLPYSGTTQEYSLTSGGDVSISKVLFGNDAYVYKHNNMLINDAKFLDIDIYGKGIVEGLLRLQCELDRPGALYPYLPLNRLQGIDKYTLDEVVNLKFVQEEIEAGNVCTVSNWLYDDANAMTMLELYAANSPTEVKRMDESKTLSNILRQNVYEIAMFLCEIYTAFSRMDFENRRDVGPMLFAYHGKTSCNFIDAFGKYDPLTCEFVSDDLARISALPNEERFDAIREYAEDTVDAHFPEVKTWDSSSRTGFCDLEIPTPLIYVCNGMHLKAIETYRVNQFALLLKLCEERGIDLSELKAEAATAASDWDSGSSSLDTPFQNFGDMSKGADYGESDVPVGSDEPKKDKPSIPKLEVIDNLLDSCDGIYDIDVVDATNEPQFKAAYEGILKPIDMITKQLTKQIREIKTYNTGGKSSGKSRGKVDPHIMYRYKTDPKIFYDNSYKIKEMDLAFGIVLDQSGSMRGDGVTNGKISLIMLHHVLNALRINHAIVGHTSSRYHHSKIMRYVTFNEDKHHTLDVPYMLANIKALNGNCDSGALNYMEQYIKRTSNKDRIVLIFSDGEPTECSDTELRNQVRKMEQEGIHVIGLGIDFENIKMYYPDHANGRNLKEMVDILTKILKRYVLEKKD